MPVTPTYPGVYVQELQSGVHTIMAVTTSVTAFVGFTPYGPTGTPVTLTSFADFERRFSGLASNSVLSYAVQHFFLNGGAVGIVVRLADGAVNAKGSIPGGGSPALTVTAANPDTFGNTLRVAIDHNTPAASNFNLQVFDTRSLVARESFTSLSMTSTDPNFVETIVNAGSQRITIKAADSTLPDPSGTVSGSFANPLPDLAQQITVTIGSTTSNPFTVYDSTKDGSAPTTMGQLAVLLEGKIRQQGTAFGAVTVAAVGRTLQVAAGPDDTVQFGGAGATTLGLEGTVHPGAYPLAGGASGSPPSAEDFIGSQAAKTGLNALRDVMDVNLLCLPDLADPSYDATRVEVLAAADLLCQDKRMFLIVDSPAGWATLDTARADLSAIDSVRSDHSALYFPQIQMTDPLSGAPRNFPPCGAVAGIMARTDGDRGVWKAPAGSAAGLSGVQGLTVPLTDLENGLLNPLGVNCLRSFPIIGPVVWGARTLQGADVLASQWKYVPVRRTALMIEESLYRGTNWVVFEPNDERLWGQIRLNVGAFMQTLFRQGAFQGTSASDAYFVKCDATTTTQNDIDQGVVNIIVGFAPLKPAEFVIIQIQQIAGQL